MSHAIPICKDSDDGWHAARREGIGGSDAPMIMGVSTFGGPAKCAALKLGYEVDAREESELLKWGRLQERPMLEALEEETGVTAVIDGTLYRHPEPDLSWMQTTLDGSVTSEKLGDGGAECKLAVYSADKWDDGVPLPVWTQVQHQIEVMGWPYSYVTVLLRGYQFRWAIVERDDEFIREKLIPAERAFWAKIQSGEAVPPSGAAPDHEHAALKALFPNVAIGKVARLKGDEWEPRLIKWLMARQRASTAAKEAKSLRNEFVFAIGDAEFGELDSGQRLTLREQTRKAHEVKASTFRVLRAMKPPGA